MGKKSYQKKAKKWFNLVQFNTIRQKVSEKLTRKNPKEIPEINDENSMEEVNSGPGPSQNYGNESSNSISSTLLNNSYFFESTSCF